MDNTPIDNMTWFVTFIPAKHWPLKSEVWLWTDPCQCPRCWRKIRMNTHPSLSNAAKHSFIFAELEVDPFLLYVSMMLLEAPAAEVYDASSDRSLFTSAIVSLPSAGGWYTAAPWSGGNGIRKDAGGSPWFVGGALCYTYSQMLKRSFWWTIQSN